MKRLTIRLALLIVCALSINTAFAQDVRQKPVATKQTTGTQKWKYVSKFSEGLAWVEDANGKTGYIDKTGKIVK